MDRNEQLKKRFLGILGGSTDVDRHKTQFLEGLSLQEDPATCVSKIVESKNGLSAVQQAMRHDLSTKFMNGLGSNVVGYLLRATGLGDVLDTVLLHILDPPIFWNKFCEEFEKGSLEEEAECVFARLLVHLLRMDNKESSRFRDRAKQPPIFNRLINSDHSEVKAAGSLIKEILSAASVSSAASRPEGPGGRHDNDFIDFREISIVPTADEVQSTKKAFFRHASLLDDPDAKDTRVADYLDNTFRLLREDMLYEMRDELQPILAKNSKRKQRGVVVEGLSIVGVYTGSEDRKNRTPHGLVLRCSGDFKIFHNVKDGDRMSFLKNDSRGSKFLSHQSLVCLIADGQLLSLGTILRVEDLLVKKPPSVVVRVSGEASFSKTLLKLTTAQEIKLVQTNTAIFSFEPVLKVIQTMKRLPLAEEILFWENGVSVGSHTADISQLTAPLAMDLSMDLQPILNTPTSIKLDKAQAVSLLSGLNQRVSLIQGPPGTGKSFIGALLAKALHDFSERTILVVCFTNHALDQFLEDLMKIGIPESNIVRLGGRANSAVSQLSLNKQTREKYVRSNAEWTIIDGLKSRGEFLRDELEKKFEGFLASKFSLGDMLTYVEFEDSDYFDAFQVPESTEGMAYVGKNGDAVDATYLISQWSQGHDAGVFKEEAHVLGAESIWSMSKAERQQKWADWRTAISRSMVDDIWKLARDYDECQDELTRKFSESSLAILKQKRIIGCTTTGAAKYTDDIRAASPGVLLVEEAGEILESHVITALGDETDHMILIGDHKQLRPKVNNYELTVEKGEGYDLNRSLFERLVLKGFPHQTLIAQHRMRPEISALIRALTYPGLTDAPKTQNRDDIRGIQNNVVFVDHSQEEDDEQRIADRGDGGTPTSKRNKFEVDMVMKIVQYIVQQGYGSENIVLLTPYLGQLSALRDALKTNAEAIMNELDAGELARAGLLSTPSAKHNKTRIRLATIDNYQGEESDIVIASLTRSNSHGAIGFMNSPERLNVLISRARDGLILIGNSDTFKSSKTGGELWRNFFSLLQNGGHIFSGFPVKCERHPHVTALIKSPAEFDSLAPDGGCTEPCGALLRCNIHTCSKKCHPLRLGPGQPDVHTTMHCNHLFSESCPEGVHQMKWKCTQGRPEKCSACEKEMKRLEKQAKLDLEAQEQREIAQRQHDWDMMELEAQLQFEREKAADIQIAKDRDDEKRQKVKELEDMRKQVKNATKQTGSSGSQTQGPSSSNPTNTSSFQSAPSGSNQPQNTGGDPFADPQDPPPTPLRPSVPSPARDKWEWQKRVDGVQNAAIDKIMDLTGLEDVKEQILRIKAKIDTMKRQDVALNSERLNLVLLGNPGTGKTTVARLYAQFLESIQVLPGGAFLETTGSKLSYEGVGGAQGLIDRALLVGGGAIFIDEAYQLTSDNTGKQVLDFLLAEMENRVGTLIFVLAGYNKEMEKFFEHNPGLPSRVPYRLQFADYTDDELMTMLEDFVLKRYQGRMAIDGGIRGLYGRIAVRRLGRGRGIPGFGNARALQNMFSRVCERQAERVEKARRAGGPTNDFFMTKEDLIGPDPSQVIPNNAAWKELQGLVGLETVKESVSNFFALVETNYHRELEEKEPLQMSLNRVFLGSPGTGKTSVAKLYGQVLVDLGLLSNGEVVVKNPSDFVGAYLGHSEKNTKAILDSTRGKVLVIDEAYMLYSGKGTGDSFKTTVIDTIVAEIQSVPGEDRCVLLLGYKEQMVEMFQNVNPGLARRFAIENAFNFEDFTESQLMEIFNYKLKKQDLAATDDAKQVARDVLSRMKDRPNFGNAGDVENLLGLAKDRYQKRMSSVPPHERSDVVFEPRDFDPDFNRDQNASTNLAKLFEDVIGCDEVIQKLDKYQKIARTMKAQGLDMRTQIPSNFVFKGPPGTGKTTTARKLGQVYYDMGFLSSTEVVECSASDLVGQYVGHTGPKTRKMFEKALGKVLFIDEAYRLSQGHFAQEAMDEIVDIMTKEKFMNKLVIILAGYDNEMNKLLGVNPGLSSRFSEEVHFHNMTPDQCLALLDKDLRKSNITITELADTNSPEYQQMQVLITRMSVLSSWGNARDIKTLGKRMFQQAFANASDGGQATITVTEAIDIMESMFKEQRDRIGVPTNRVAKSSPPPIASLSGPPPPPPPIATSSSSQSSKPPPPPPPPPSSSNAPKRQPPPPKSRGPPSSANPPHVPPPAKPGRPHPPPPVPPLPPTNAPWAPPMPSQPHFSQQGGSQSPYVQPPPGQQPPKQRGKQKGAKQPPPGNQQPQFNPPSGPMTGPNNWTAPPPPGQQFPKQHGKQRGAGPQPVPGNQQPQFNPPRGPMTGPNNWAGPPPPGQQFPKQHGKQRGAGPQPAPGNQQPRFNPPSGPMTGPNNWAGPPPAQQFPKQRGKQRGARQPNPGNQQAQPSSPSMSVSTLDDWSAPPPPEQQPKQRGKQKGARQPNPGNQQTQLNSSSMSVTELDDWSMPPPSELPRQQGKQWGARQPAPGDYQTQPSPSMSVTELSDWGAPPPPPEQQFPKQKGKQKAARQPAPGNYQTQLTSPSMSTTELIDWTMPPPPVPQFPRQQGKQKAAKQPAPGNYQFQLSSPSMSVTELSDWGAPPPPPGQQFPKQKGKQKAGRQPAPGNYQTQLSSPSVSATELDDWSTPPSNTRDQRDPGVPDFVWNQLQADKRIAEEEKKRAREEEARLKDELDKARDAERRAEEWARLREAALENNKQLAQVAEEKAEQERLQHEREAAQPEAEAKAVRERAVVELWQKQQEEAKRQQREQERLSREMEAAQRDTRARALRERAVVDLMRKQQEEAERQQWEQERLQAELEAAQKREAEVKAARERAAAELRRKQREEAQRRQKEQEKLRREMEAAQKREAEAKAARERAVAELKRKQQEEAQKRKKEQEIVRKLQLSGCCPMGYQWLQQQGGWRCAGGTHFVTEAQLRQM